MVKVVGKDESQVLKATCRNCASILEYLRSEVQSVTSRDYSGDSDTYYHIDCPNCGKEVSVRRPL